MAALGNGAFDEHKSLIGFEDALILPPRPTAKMNRESGQRNRIKGGCVK